MAIVKCANRSGSTVRGLVNYVMDDDKIECVDVYGMDKEIISKDFVISQMNETKSLFGKMGGREVYHLIISFHKDELITPEDANRLALELYESIPEFHDREALLVTQRHSDDSNIHTHIVINTVSFEDGSKLHTSRSWLQNIKDTNDDILRKNYLSVVEKGFDFYGNQIDRNEPWNMERYIVKNELSEISWKDKIVKSIAEVTPNSTSKEQFIGQLANDNIIVRWTDNRKHITFIDAEGHKIRDTRIEKDYGLSVTKENLINRFEENLNIELSKEDDGIDSVDISFREWDDDYHDLVEWDFE